LKVG